MTRRPVVPREHARRDVAAAVGFYANEAGEGVAPRFIGAVESAYRAIGRQPAAGSPRYGQELDLPGLRGRLLRRFPYLVVYIERDDRVDVWRARHAQRDIPAWLREPLAKGLGAASSLAAVRPEGRSLGKRPRGDDPPGGGQGARGRAERTSRGWPFRSRPRGGGARRRRCAAPPAGPAGCRRRSGGHGSSGRRS